MTKRLLVDVSEMTKFVSGGAPPSGIQRVVANIVGSLIQCPELLVDLRPCVIHRGKLIDVSAGFMSFTDHLRTNTSESRVDWDYEVQQILRAIESTKSQRSVLKSGDALKMEVAANLPPAARTFVGNTRRFLRLIPYSQKECNESISNRDKGFSNFVKSGVETNVRSSDIFFAADAGWGRSDYYNVIEQFIEAGANILSTVYDIIPLRLKALYHPDMIAIFDRWVSFLVGNSRHIFCISEFTRNDLSAWAYEHSLRIPELSVMPLAAEPAIARPPRASVAALQARAEPFCLFVSTLEARKNHSLLVECWAKLAEEYQHRLPVLILVGRISGNTYNRSVRRTLQRLSPLRDRVIHVSGISDNQLALLYSAARFTIFPSLYEGWGLPVTESLYYGTPVIAAGVTSVPEAGGQWADYFDPHCPEALRDKIEKFSFDDDFLSSRREQLKSFSVPSWRRQAEQLITVASAV